MKKVKIGTCLALRGAALAEVALRHSQPWIVEAPAVKDGKPSVTKLSLGILFVTGMTLQFGDCTIELGAPTKKATELWGTASLQGLPTECSHDNDDGPHL